MNVHLKREKGAGSLQMKYLFLRDLLKDEIKFSPIIGSEDDCPPPLDLNNECFKFLPADYPQLASSMSYDTAIALQVL